MVVVAVVAAVGALLLTGGGGGRELAAGVELVDEDPFAYEQSRSEEFLARGADGLSHVLYALSPGGVEATAERTLRFEDEIALAARAEGVRPSTLEALVFLESAGRPEVIAGGSDPEQAAGLAQILPGTATDLLGMSVDIERSKRLTRRIAERERRAERAGSERQRERAERELVELRAERRRVDERFDPPAALAGAARYLAIGQERFGREDLATVSYHMGIGNLEGVIEAYIAPAAPAGTIRETVAREGLSYAQLYFDSTPVRNPRTYARLRELGDDSRRYLFRLEAAREVLRLHREDPPRLARLAELHRSKASREEVLHPPDTTRRFETADQLRAAYDDGALVQLRGRTRELGFRIDPQMGQRAERLGEQPELYRGLRPEALAALVYIAEDVREITGRATTLNLTSSVRDHPYQAMLRRTNPQATDGYSLHTTGFSFDVARDLPTRGEDALIAVLERMRALNVLDFVFEPGAIHVTVGREAEALLAE